MKRRLTSWLLTLAMLLSLMPAMGVTASAADDTSYTQAEIRNYATFATYLRSSDSRDLKLMEDIDYTVGIDDVSIDVIRNQKLDLNGHKITINASKRTGFENLLCIRRGEFTLYDSKGGGELAVSFPNDDKAYSIIMMSSEKKDEPAKFTMNGGTLTKLHPNMTYTYGASGCIGDDYFNKPENGKRSQITINGGTINCPYEWDRSKPLLSLPVKAMPLALQLLYSNLTINGGTFNGIVWTDNLWRGTQDTEPRVVLNGGEFNAPFVVEDMSRTATQMVIDGAHFNDGFHVNNRYSKNTDVGTVPQLLLKSGVFNSPDKNPKLDIYSVTAAHGDSSITKNRVILHAMKCFPNSAIKVNEKIYTSENIKSLVRSNDTGYYLNFNSNTPIEVIRDAWGVMESVTLDGKKIDYFKDWKGTVENLTNDTAHTLKFEWNPLASELVNAGYTYRTKCEHYISGSTAVQQTDTIAADKTSHTITIPAGADPKVYSYDLQLNLQKDSSNVGIFTNDHIVKLVVNPAPVVTTISSAPVRLSAALTPGTSFPRATAVGSGYTVDSINWYTNSECNNPASTFAARTDYFGKIVLKPEKNYKFAASTSAVPFCDDPNENYSIVGSATVEADGSLTLIVKGTTVSALVWDSVDKTNQTYTIGDNALTLHAKAAGGDNSKPITYKLIAEKDGTETVKASATVAETKDFSASLRFTDTGSYACWFEATRGGVTITSEAFTVTVKAPGLSIENQSGDLTVKQNATARLFVKAKGHGVKYEWQVKNGDTWDQISHETAYDYAAPTTDAGEKTYRCVVTDNYGGTQNSNEMTVTVIEGADTTLTPAIPLAAVNGEVPDPIKLWSNKNVKPNGWQGLEAKYNVTVGETFKGVAAFSTIPADFEMNNRNIYSGKTPVLGTISYEWKGTAKNLGEATSTDFTPYGSNDNATITMPSEAGTYYVVLSVTNTIGEGSAAQAERSTVNITFHVSEAHEHTYAYAQLDATNHTKYCTAGDYSDTEKHTPDGNMCKYCGYAPANNYSVNVTNGSATPTADVAPGTKVTLTANPAPTGQVFDKWVGNVNVTGNTFNMPSHHVTVAATYKPIAHTHDTDKQTWTSFNDDVHSRSCSAGDDVQFADHKFNSWTDNGDGTHTGTCTECGYVKTEMIPATGGGSSSGGGGGGGGVGTSAYAITVNSVKNGGVTASHKSASKGTTVTLTVAPDKGYVLDTLTVLDGKDKEIKLTEKSGKFTFTMPDSKVTVAAMFKASAPTGKNPFTDVPAGSYYETAVIWAVDKGITGGTSATTFSPEATCTRAQIVTFLWRAAGSPEPKAMSTFVDVSADAYYAKAVAWAVENGITGGTGDGKFSPDATCTRAQAVTFLWRANGSPAVSGNAAFRDVAANAYYAAAVTWAEKNGITGGIGGGLFGSDNTCTRAQIVTFLYRAFNK